MSCTDFPSTGLIPNVTTHTVGNITYIWTGIAWESQVNVPAGELEGLLVNDLSQAYIFDTVADFKASTIVFPVGKTIHLNDRGADFEVIAGTGTANTFNIIASTSINQSVDLVVTPQLSAKQWGVGGTSDDTAGVQDFVDYVMTNNSTIPKAYFPAGNYTLTSTINLTTASVAIIGEYDDRRQSGTALPTVTFTWEGGASPMFTCNKADVTFTGFGTANLTNATCWLELTLGAQKHVYERLYFIKGTGVNEFSQAVIISDGARTGYSQFKHIIGSSPAPRFLHIKNSSVTGSTPITFSDRCIFRAIGNSFVIVDLENSTLESLIIEKCTFIATTDEIVLLDTTNNPTARPINMLTINNNEFDADSGTIQPTDRFLKLTNVENITMQSNHMNGGGGGASFATLVNSKVSSFSGNYFKSLDYIFEADDNSIVRGIGLNSADWSTMQGTLDNPKCTYIELTQSTVITIDGALLAANEVETLKVDIIDASAYTFSLDITRPQNMEVGQKFNIIIRNKSGGNIAAPSFVASRFSVQGIGFTPPVNGREITIPFRFDGDQAQQYGAVSPEVPVSTL